MESEMTICPLPYSSRVDVHGDVRMSSHTALVSDAAIHLAESNPNADIFIAGESTFGTNFPSTADLMKQQMVRKGIDGARISTVAEANDTESQIQAIRARNITNPDIVALDFHIDRVKTISSQNGVDPVMHQAEELIILNHSGATKERLEKIIAAKPKILGRSKLLTFEKIARRAVKFGKPGKTALALLRRISNADGPTITDYHMVDAARKHTPASS